MIKKEKQAKCANGHQRTTVSSSAPSCHLLSPRRFDTVYQSDAVSHFTRLAYLWTKRTRTLGRRTNAMCGRRHSDPASLVPRNGRLRYGSYPPYGARPYHFACGGVRLGIGSEETLKRSWSSLITQNETFHARVNLVGKAYQKERVIIILVPKAGS